MDNFRIYPYNMGSKGARLLAEELNTKRVSSRLKPRKSVDIIVNWGNPRIPPWDKGQYEWTNHPITVSLNSNKKDFFNVVVGNTPGFLKYINTYEQAVDYLNNNSDARLYQRNVLTGHSGSGIIMCDSDNPPTQRGKLWTVGVKGKRREYRALASTEGVFSLLVKKRRNGWRDLSTYDTDVRTEKTGWAFCSLREGELSDDQYESVEKACEDYFSLPDALDFAGIDLIINSSGVTIIEVNSAPGLGGASTVAMADLLYDETREDSYCV